MKKSYTKIILIVLIGILFIGAKADKNKHKYFSWDPITEQDWNAAEDPKNNIRNALMLFEKITRDDNPALYEITIYRRIKIFNALGREWGDYSVPYVHKKQKIVQIYGRTVLPDGREFPLSKNQIFDKEIVRTKGVKVKQKSFSLPGLSDGCIVEYYVKYTSPIVSRVWWIQKKIAMLQGDFVWKFRRWGYIPQGFFRYISENFTPNFFRYPDTSPVLTTFHPSYLEAKEIHFSVKNIPAFEAEPNSASELMQVPQVHCYYGSVDSPEKYWKDINKNIIEAFNLYCKKNKRVREIIASFGDLTDQDSKISACYNWAQQQLKNISYLEDDSKYKDNQNLDDVLKRGYGTQEEINFVFQSLLREMNINAQLAFVIDRDEGIFLSKAKYWQFDHPLVAVPIDSTKYQFMSPGDAFLPITHAPLLTEGVQAYVIGDSTPKFIGIPYSKPDLNRTLRSLKLCLEDDLNLKGEIHDSRSGFYALNTRILLSNVNDDERDEKLSNDLETILPNAKFDSISVHGLEESDKHLIIKSKLQLSNPEQQIGSRLFIKPFSFLAQTMNPFQSSKRHHPIIFDYAYELIEVLTFEIPDTWKIEALPADTSFANKVGFCEVKFAAFGETLSVQRCFKLNSPNWSVRDYSFVKNLFQARQSFFDLTCVLKQK